MIELTPVLFSQCQFNEVMTRSVRGDGRGGGGNLIDVHRYSTKS